MKRADLTEFEIEEEGFKLRIARGGKGGAVVTATPTSLPPFPAPTPVTAPTAGAPAVATSAGASGAEKQVEEGLLIKSPMVGTFYRSPSPESPPFTDVGERVNPDTTVCIIEAMKVMNEIQAEVKGVISEVLVENGASVEYGQPLFRVKPQ